MEHLAQTLLGGPVEPEVFFSDLAEREDVVVRGNFVTLRGHENLLSKTIRRHRSHAALASTYLELAREFCRDLVAHCPFVRCVAVSGSLGSGGFATGDDVDFDLFVEDGTKYLVYLLAVLLGLKYSWRHRRRRTRAVHATPLLPKVTCVNVVWTLGDTAPFVRQDASLALELVRSRPLYGADCFQEVLEANPWLRLYFPQLYSRTYRDEVSEPPSPLHRFLRSLGRHPWALRTLEAVSRGVSWLLYHFVQWTRRHNPEARAHQEFLREVKYPYEVFQD